MSYSKFSPMNYVKAERARKAADQAREDKAASIAREKLQAAIIRQKLSEQRALMGEFAEARIARREVEVVAPVLMAVKVAKAEQPRKVEGRLMRLRTNGVALRSGL